MYIPDEWLPPVTVGFDDRPKVPPMPLEYQRGVYAGRDAEFKARFYLKEATQKLALAKYWLERTEENG